MSTDTTWSIEDLPSGPSCPNCGTISRWTGGNYECPNTDDCNTSFIYE